MEEFTSDPLNELGQKIYWIVLLLLSSVNSVFHLKDQRVLLPQHSQANSTLFLVSHCLYSSTSSIRDCLCCSSWFKSSAKTEGAQKKNAQIIQPSIFTQVSATVRNHWPETLCAHASYSQLLLFSQGELAGIISLNRKRWVTYGHPYPRCVQVSVE